MRETFDVVYVMRDRSGSEAKYRNVRVYVEPLDAASEPPLEARFPLQRGEAQELFDQLWSLGFRPPAHEASEFRAISAHLQDMRAIVFSKLEVQKP